MGRFEVTSKVISTRALNESELDSLMASIGSFLVSRGFTPLTHTQVQKIMTDEQFEGLIAGKSQNTTIPTMRKAQAFIVRGLLSRGTERKGYHGSKQNHR